MLLYIEEFGKYVEITGYKNIAFHVSEAFLKANRKQTHQNLDIQFFDAEIIATQEHLYCAVLNALQAFKNQTNLSKTPAMETILYASAQRQIQKAIERCGIKPKTKNMALIIIGDDPIQMRDALEEITKSVGSDSNESVLTVTKNKEAIIKKTFKISNQELKTVIENGETEKAIVNLVIERVALLSTQL